ncbi:MAG: radical SAM protein, partial [Myxococcales bacterium]|nr:radical SAM protein [Myxococcales bacterium]
MSLHRARRRLPVVDALPRSGNRYYSERKAREHPSPTYAVWELTLACDQRCSACGPRAGKARGDELTTVEALDVVEQLAAIGVGEVTLIGGEAYLRDDIFDLVHFLTQGGVRVTMQTGGRGLSPRLLKQLVQA